MGWMARGSNPGRGMVLFFFFRFSKSFRQTLSPNQRPIQWIPGLIPGRGLMLSTHLYLVPRLRMDSVIPLLHLYTFVHGWGDLYLLLHGVTSHRNTLLMLTAQRTINIAYGFDVRGDKFLKQVCLPRYL
jgi:hypothetical protein